MAGLYSSVKKWLASSPPGEWASDKLANLIVNVLKQGPVPQHVAFEMDGNRRFARMHNIEAIEGHHHGFRALLRMLEVCYDCGVKVVTIYAFSVDNFRRPKYEVDGLMQLAKMKLEQIARHGYLLKRYGAAVRLIGERSLLPPDVLEVADKVIEMCNNSNTTVVLNVCFPYTSRHEMAAAIQSTVQEYSTSPQPKNTPFSQTRISQKILSKKLDEHDGLPTIPEPESSASNASDDDANTVSSSATTLPSDSPPLYHDSDSGAHHMSSLPNPENITVNALDRHMYLADCPPLDIFVRTSGVTRLSDFMLWQCHEDTRIFFLDCLWPELNLWTFLPVLMEWQWKCKQKAREERPYQGHRATLSVA